MSSPRPAKRRWLSVLGLLPQVLAGVLVVAPFAWAAYVLVPYGDALVVAMWLLPAPLLFMARDRTLMGRVWYGWRDPAPAEAARLHGPWGQVAEETGLAGHPLLVAASDELTVPAPGGQVVVVTSRAVALDTEGLRAVLAHQAGHVAGTSMVVSFAEFVFMVPVRGLVRLHSGLWDVVRLAWRGARAWGTPAGYLGVGLLAVVAAVLFVTLAIPGLLAYAGLALMGAAGGRAVREADRFAANLGYGRALLALLEAAIETNTTDERLRRRAHDLRRYLHGAA